MVCLALVVLQTAVVPYVPLLDGFYDLTACLVIYLGLFRPVREGAVVVLIMGFVMDTLSGAPFGLYLVSYVWLFIGIRWVIGYLRVTNTLLLPLALVSGILLQSAIFLTAVSFLDPQAVFFPTGLRLLAEQALWALTTGVLFLGAFGYTRDRWLRFMRGRFEPNGNP
jgi:hypothetical protein